MRQIPHGRSCFWSIETIEVAFLLNVAIFLAIQVCSGLVYSLAGIVKDRLLTLTH